jgi:hypothetical protein
MKLSDAERAALAVLESRLLATDRAYVRRHSKLQRFLGLPAGPTMAAMLGSLVLLLLDALTLAIGSRLGDPVLVVAAVVAFPITLMPVLHSLRR